MNSGGDLSQQQQQQPPPQQVQAQPSQPQPPQPHYPQHHPQHQQWLAMQQYQQQQQQWMSMHMQYPAAAMVMQQQMMYGGLYVPAAAYYHQQQQQHQMYQQQQQQQQQHQQQYKQGQMQVPSEENRTIWIGDLQPWMDESYLQTCFAQASEVISVKVIRNKQTGQSERYGFVEFGSHAAADKVLQGFNGSSMPNSDQVFRLNWAAFSMGNRRPEAGGPGAGASTGVGSGSDLSIFVGDLASDVTDAVLHETFASKYPSVKGAKVVVDPNTGRSKGYGFVRFGDENERTQALTEMNGAYCSSRQMRIGVATPKKASTQLQYSSQAVVLAGGYPSNGVPLGLQSDSDSSNTTIFVGGLDSEVTDEELRESFSQYGEVISVKIPSGKGCGFVQFANRSNAEDAIQRLNGATIGKQTVRLSWGRTPVNKQFKSDSGYQWYGPYGRHGQNGYGYPMQQNQDRNMYAATAANGHGGYQQPVN